MNVSDDRKKLDVTVVVPAHNHPEWLAEAVTSVQMQTLPCNLVIVDDGSAVPVSNSTITQSKVTHIRIEQSGPAIARNRGLDSVDTPFVLFLDADDKLMPDAVETLRATLLKEPKAVAAGGHIRYLSGDGRRATRTNRHVPTDLPMEEIARGRFVPWPPSAALLRTDIVARIGGFDETYSTHRDWFPEDLDFWARLASEGHFAHVGRPVAYYRVSATSATTTSLMLLARGGDFAAARIRAKRDGNDLSPDEFEWEPSTDLARALYARALLRSAGVEWLNGGKVRAVIIMAHAACISPSIFAKRLLGKYWRYRGAFFRTE